MPPKRKRILVNKEPTWLDKAQRVKRYSSTVQEIHNKEKYRNRPSRMQIFRFITRDRFNEKDIDNYTTQLMKQYLHFYSDDKNAQVRLDVDIFTPRTRYSQKGYKTKYFGNTKFMTNTLSLLDKFESGEFQEVDFSRLNIRSFYVYAYITQRQGGKGVGDNKYCFWNCIKDFIVDFDLIFNGKVEKLVEYVNKCIQNNREYENCELCDTTEGKVNTDQIDTILSILKTDLSITVYGPLPEDATYNNKYIDGREIIFKSKVEQKRNLNLILQDEHYTIGKNKGKVYNEKMEKVFKEKLVSPKYIVCKDFINPEDKYAENILVLYRYHINTGEFDYIDNPTHFHLYGNDDDKSNGKSTRITMDYLRKLLNDETSDGLTVFITYIKMIEQLKRFNKYFNLFKFKNISHFIRHFIHNQVKKINLDDKFQPITENEYKIYSLTKGQLQRPDNSVDVSKMYHYDQTSSYPYMLKRGPIDVKNECKPRKAGETYNMFLFNQREYRKLFSVEKMDLLCLPLIQPHYNENTKKFDYLKRNIQHHELHYGIYPVKIILPEDNKYKKFFVENKDNYYTHWDLMVAYAMDPVNVKFEPIDNFRYLYWIKTNKTQPEIIETCEIFQSYVRQMFLTRKTLNDSNLPKRLFNHSRVFNC